MLLAILLQIVTLLPPTPSSTATPDANYLKDIQKLAAEETWPLAATDALAPKQPSHRAALANLLHQGTNAEVRLTTILGSGCDGSSPLGYAFWRRGALEFEEAKTIACLLAPATVPPDVLPLLAWMAIDPHRSLPIRATALARLLDADQVQTWPLVHAMLRTGTAEDLVTEKANWNRSGRYELPKRILLLSIQSLLQRHQMESTEFEPNAAWGLQFEQLRNLDSVIKNIWKAKIPQATRSTHPWKRLLLLSVNGSAHARSAHQLLLPSTWPIKNAASQ